MNKRIAIISSTFDKAEDAEKIGQKLLGAHQIACAQISSPIISLYRWQGQFEQSEEVVLTMKTLVDKLAEVQGVLESEHPYDTPEILVRTDCEVSQKYFDWMQEEVK